MHKYFNLFNAAYISLFLDEVIQADGYTLCFSHSNKRVYWNGANQFNIREGTVNEAIVDLELLFTYHKIRPSVWLCPEDWPDFLEKEIKDRGYNLVGEEEWLKYEKKENIPVGLKGITIVEVKSPQHLAAFIRVFDSIWGENNPGYSEVFKKKIFDERHMDKSKIYVGYVSGKEVCIGGYVSDCDTAFLHSLATVEHMRGRGYGTAMINHIMNSTSNSEIILQVEKSNSLSGFYKKMGFDFLMPVKYYSKN